MYATLHTNYKDAILINNNYSVSDDGDNSSDNSSTGVQGGTVS
jgi:hypothetical protein